MRHPQAEAEFSRNAALYREFDWATATKLVRLGIEAGFEPGQLIFREHDHSGQFLYITSGSVALEQPTTDHSIRIQTLHEGDFLGWSALLGSGTRHFQARALTPVAVLTFDGEFLCRKCDDDPLFGFALMKRLLLLVTERLDAARGQLAESRRGEVGDWDTGSTSH
jgi:CRP-like cAMP-binding protein